MQLFEIIFQHTWVVIDDLSNYTTQTTQHHLKGSIACRQLLIKVQKTLMFDGIFNENHFPYQLQSQDQKFFLSFSHSRQQIAILISKSHQVGIDIENRFIRQAIVSRCFTENEVQWLQQCQKQVSIEQFNHVKTLFWTLKESLLKYQADKNSLLSFWLKQDLLHVLGEEHIQTLVSPTLQFNQIQIFNQLIGFSPINQCGFVVKNSPNEIFSA